MGQASAVSGVKHRLCQQQHVAGGMLPLCHPSSPHTAETGGAGWEGCSLGRYL